NKAELTQSQEASADNIIDEHVDLKASANKSSDPIGLIYQELSSLTTQILIESIKQVVNPMNRQFNAFNKLESTRMKVRKGMEEVPEKLSYFTMRVDQNSVHVQEMKTLMGDMVGLLEAASLFAKDNAKGEKWEKEKPDLNTTEPDTQIPDLIQGEQPP
ncbi:hypothetical protein Tco_1495561, partial [Tanacetum coccineum]